MEKYFFDERNGLWYELQGDYYLPCLKLPEVEQQPVGLWGQRHLRYIKQNRKVFYLNLLTSGKLNGYLSDIDKQADDMFFSFCKANGRVRRCNRTAKSRKSNGVGGSDEQYPQQSLRNHKQQFD